MWETWIWPLEERMATHSSILAWRIPMERGAWSTPVYGVAESAMTERPSTTQYRLKTGLPRGCRWWSSAQFSSVSQSHLTLCDPADCSTPGLPVHPQLLGLAQTQVHWVSDAVQPSHPLSSPSPPSFNLSQQQGLFKWVNSSHQMPKYWSFSFSISLSSEHPELISFRMDWLDLLAVQGTLKSLLQHHSSKASILQCSAFFIVQLSHLYMTTGKTIAFTRWTFVDKVRALLFNMLSRLIIAFLPRSSYL